VNRSIFPNQRKIAPGERPQFRGPKACVHGKYEEGQQCRRAAGRDRVQEFLFVGRTDRAPDIVPLRQFFDTAAFKLI
jgi:hypothetical protein